MTKTYVWLWGKAVNEDGNVVFFCFFLFFFVFFVFFLFFFCLFFVTSGSGEGWQ